jgi:hypothetical protein
MTSEFELAESLVPRIANVARRLKHDTSPRPRFLSDRPLADDPSANVNEFTRDITQRL